MFQLTSNNHNLLSTSSEKTEKNTILENNKRSIQTYVSNKRISSHWVMYKNVHFKQFLKIAINKALLVLFHLLLD